jgi:hypothetical protein
MSPVCRVHQGGPVESAIDDRVDIGPRVEQGPDRFEVANFNRQFLDEVRIRNLKVGKASVDLLFQRHPQDVSVRVLRMDGQVVIEKTGSGSSL